MKQRKKWAYEEMRQLEFQVREMGAVEAVSETILFPAQLRQTTIEEV